MARDHRKTDLKYAGDLPKFSDVLKRNRAQIKNLASDNVKVYIEWDFNESAKKHEVFRLITEKNGVRHEATVSWQELQHYGRAI